MPTIENRTALSQEQILHLQDKAQTKEELDAITTIGLEVKRQRLKAAVDRFRENSHKFVDVAGAIGEQIREIHRAHPGTRTPALDLLLRKYGGILSELHERDAMRKTDQEDGLPVIENDEESLTPAPHPELITADARPESPLRSPKPLDSRSFDHLADEYFAYYVRSQIRPGKMKDAKKLVKNALAFKPRYLEVGRDLDIPWWFVAGIHMLESTFNFTTHLHNGDSLREKTRRVPKGRPNQGERPFSWEDSARDALEGHRLSGLQDWSLPRALWRWERYNGFGYRAQGIPTPYLWSFSTIYERGKFVRDGEFSANASSAQCGTAVLLKALHQAGEVSDLAVDVVAEDESNHPDSDTDIAEAVSLDLPNIDGEVPAGHEFQSFFSHSFPEFEHFEWHEFLVKGVSHGQNSLNSDPPRELWPNAIPLIRTLQAFRREVRQPVLLTSVYRSPAYNASIGGASRSQHMAFTAADFKVSGGGDPGSSASVLKRLRQQGLFEGGIGIYNSFVHVDARGTRADWDKRSG